MRPNDSDQSGSVLLPPSPFAAETRHGFDSHLSSILARSYSLLHLPATLPLVGKLLPLSKSNVTLPHVASISSVNLSEQNRSRLGESRQSLMQDFSHNNSTNVDMSRQMEVVTRTKSETRYESHKRHLWWRIKTTLSPSVERKEALRARVRRILNFFRIFLTHLFSTTGLCFLVMGYSCLGAFLFAYLEAHNERELRNKMKFERERCAYDLWVHTLSLNVFHPVLWKKLAEDRVKEFEEKIIDAVQKDGYSLSEEQWSFSGALLYSVTVITTIGYGNVTCKTDWGRIATIIYAIFGIPITFLCLANLGNLMAEAFRFGYRKICCCDCFTSKHSKSQRRAARKREVRRLRRQLSLRPQPKKEPEVQIQLNSLNLSSPPSPLDSAECAQAPPSKNTKKYVDLRRTQSLHSSHGKPIIKPNLPVQSNQEESKSLTMVSMENENHPTTELINNILDLACSSDSDGKSDDEKAREEEKKRVPIFLVLCLVVGYIILGTFMFSIWENWGPIEGAYFCFTTLTTIGFGDLVPGSARFSYHKDGQTKFIFCCVYMMVGLSLIAMSFNLVQEEIVIKCRRVARRLGIMPNLTGTNSSKYRKSKSGKVNKANGSSRVSNL